jgi:hypothetical protein
MMRELVKTGCQKVKQSSKTKEKRLKGKERRKDKSFTITDKTLS